MRRRAKRDREATRYTSNRGSKCIYLIFLSPHWFVCGNFHFSPSRFTRWEVHLTFHSCYKCHLWLSTRDRVRERERKEERQVLLFFFNTMAPVMLRLLSIKSSECMLILPSLSLYSAHASPCSSSSAARDTTTLHSASINCYFASTGTQRDAKWIESNGETNYKSACS